LLTNASLNLCWKFKIFCQHAGQSVGARPNTQMWAQALTNWPDELDQDYEEQIQKMKIGPKDSQYGVMQNANR
jgi:hypothetical protein